MIYDYYEIIFPFGGPTTEEYDLLHSLGITCGHLYADFGINYHACARVKHGQDIEGILKDSLIPYNAINYAQATDLNSYNHALEATISNEPLHLGY